MSFIPPLPSMQLKKFTLFLIQGFHFSANNDKDEGHSANGKILYYKISFIPPKITEPRDTYPKIKHVLKNRGIA